MRKLFAGVFALGLFFAMAAGCASTGEIQALQQQLATHEAEANRRFQALEEANARMDGKLQEAVQRVEEAARRADAAANKAEAIFSKGIRK